ncbi:MAG TPA: DUF1206 domain-containing protein [Vicinamibacteria bacterium]|jgi:hypothetical protein|nr:DUF1206 domain-containing protein [Vicinamibacteria bacterium]
MPARPSSAHRAWIERVARFGFAARGLVYILVGLLAAGAAAGMGSRATDPHGALRAVGRQPLGTAFLAVLACGLAAYAIWRFLQAGLDLERKGSSVGALAVRASFIASGIGHATLAFTAASLAVGLHEGRSDVVRTWVGRVLDEPNGRWLVGAVGLTVIGSALYQFYKAYSCKFEDDLVLSRMTDGARRWSRRIGQTGLVARGVTFAVIGWFLVRAALEVNAHEARGLAGALRVLGRQDRGHWLLLVVALGLTAYGLLSLVDARYRRVT